eukprot:7215478-Pyramimonas_sp.AAC.1
MRRRRIYDDNVLIIGADKYKTDQPLGTVRDVLEGKGMIIHEVEEGAHDLSFLGPQLSGGDRPSIQRRNLWRLRFAIEALLRRRRCSGHLLRALLGHYLGGSDPAG